jgi:hypothetical protein
MKFRIQYTPVHADTIREIVGDFEAVEVYPGTMIATVEGDESTKQALRDTGLDGCGLAILGMAPFDPDSPTLTITFPSAEHAAAFKSWLCNSGEQYFWDWCDYDNGPASVFDYHDPGGSVIRAEDME